MGPAADTEALPVPQPEPPSASWLLVLFTFLVLPVAIGGVLFSPPVREGALPVGGNVAFQLSLVLPALAWAHLSGLRRLPLLRLTWPPRMALLLGAGTAFATMLAGYGLVALPQVLGWSSAPARQGAYAGLAEAGVGPWLFVVFIAILPGLCEELLFRGALQTALLRGRSPARAVAVGALAFAFFHLDPAGFPAHLLAGLAFGWLAWRTGSLWPGVVAHALCNLATVPVMSSAGGAWVAAVGRSERNDLLYAWTTLAAGLALFGLVVAAARRWMPPSPETSSFLVRRLPGASPRPS